MTELLVGIYQLPAGPYGAPVVGVDARGNRWLLTPRGWWKQIMVGWFWDRTDGYWRDENDEEVKWDQ